MTAEELVRFTVDHPLIESNVGPGVLPRIFL